MNRHLLLSCLAAACALLWQPGYANYVREGIEDSGYENHDEENSWRGEFADEHEQQVSSRKRHRQDRDWGYKNRGYGDWKFKDWKPWDADAWFEKHLPFETGGRWFDFDPPEWNDSEDEHAPFPEYALHRWLQRHKRFHRRFRHFWAHFKEHYGGKFHDSQPPAPIPVPGAIWLFGSGLAGLVVLTRRRRG